MFVVKEGKGVCFGLLIFMGHGHALTATESPFHLPRQHLNERALREKKKPVLHPMPASDDALFLISNITQKDETKISPFYEVRVFLQRFENPLEMTWVRVRHQHSE